MPMPAESVFNLFNRGLLCTCCVLFRLPYDKDPNSLNSLPGTSEIVQNCQKEGKKLPRHPEAMSKCRNARNSSTPVCTIPTDLWEDKPI